MRGAVITFLAPVLTILCAGPLRAAGPFRAGGVSPTTDSVATRPARSAGRLLARTDWLFAAGTGAVLAVAGANDEWLRGEGLEADSRGERTLARIAQPLGNGAVVAPALLAADLAARMAHASTLAAGVERIGICTGVAAVAAVALKEIVGRSRPGEAPGDPDRIRPFSGHNSFPSGHTTVAFALAAAADAESRARWLPWTTYPLAALVGWSRVRDGQHWASDVAGGAALGLWSARKADAVLRDPAHRGVRLGFVPWLRADSRGVALSSRF